MHNPNQFIASQNLPYKLFKLIYKVIFSPNLRLISKTPQHYGKSKLQWTPLPNILNRNIIIIHFDNQVFKLKLNFKKNLTKI